MMAISGTRHTRARLSSFHRDDGSGDALSLQSDDHDMLSREELSDVMKLTFDNTTVDDVKHSVLDNNLKLPMKAETFLQKLKVDPDMGIPEAEVEARKSQYGSNVIPVEDQTPLWELMLEALKDPTLIFLCFAAVVSLIIGVRCCALRARACPPGGGGAQLARLEGWLSKDPMGWLEGTAILTAVSCRPGLALPSDLER
eukprot:2736706-Rhodomonas_salina.2